MSRKNHCCAKAETIHIGIPISVFAGFGANLLGMQWIEGFSFLDYLGQQLVRVSGNGLWAIPSIYYFLWLVGKLLGRSSRE